MLSCFLPHEVFYNLVATHGLHACAIGPDRVDDPGIPGLMKDWCDHPSVTMRHDPADVTAFGLHADGVSYTSSSRAGEAKKVIYAGSFNLISSRDVQHRALRHLCWVVSKSKLCDCGCGGFHTFQYLHMIIAWSMNILMLGKTPSRRHDASAWTPYDMKSRLDAGLDLPAGALLQYRGDL